MALTLAIGFLVDDAIVFLENTVRLMEAGKSALEATLYVGEGNQLHHLAMTISLAAVFIPLVFMSGLVGRIFREFSITIIVSIFASGIVSLTLTPLMCSRLLGKRGEGAKKNLDGAGDRRGRAARAGRLWPIAVVLPAPPLDFRGDLGDLPGRARGILFYIVPKAFPADRRQLVRPRSDRGAGGLVAGADACATRPRLRRSCTPIRPWT